MSVQLILYPQSYEGEFNSITSFANEFVVDGINFNTINASNSYDSPTLTNTLFDVLTNAPPIYFNYWFRFRTTTSGTPTLPTETSGNLVLESAASGSFSGVYQRLSNLVAGTTYEMVIDLDQVSAGGFVFTSVYNGSGYVLDSINAAQDYQITFTWTAVTANDTIVISYLNTVNDTIRITNISVTEQGVTPTEIFTDLEDGQVICDLYEDEDIPLTLSVDDFKNVAEKVQSYSKAFNLPATKRNNLIFDNIFEVTRTDTGLNFNPYKKTQCVLKQDGFLLFEGYLRLIDISDKEAEISYNVNLYSEVIALADVLKDRTFSELDFTELDHDYEKQNIKRSWRDAGGGTGMTFLNPSTSGFRDDYTTLRYPFVDWSHQIAVGGSNASAATDGNPELLTLEAAFRPFINIRYLIDRIFNQDNFPFTYQSAFFDTDDFKKLYMDFNWGANNSPVIFSSSGSLTNTSDFLIPNSFTTLDFASMSSANIGGASLNANFGYSSGVFTAQEDGQVYNFSYDMDFKKVFGSSVTITVQWLVNGVPFNPATSSNTIFNYAGSFTTPPLSAGDTILCQAKGSVSSTYFLDSVFNPLFPSSTPSVVTITTSVAQTTTDTLLDTLRGELGQFEFLKGIMTMFNLVSIPDKDNPNNILMEPYADVFINNTSSGTTSDLSLASRGIAHDWTDKIDIAEMKLIPLTDLNKKTIFKFVEDDDDYPFMIYKNSVGGHLYGSKEFDASDFTVLIGEDEIVAEPFAATVVKPLMSQFPQFITPAIYSMNEDGNSEGFENSPRIMYNNGVKDTGASYFIPTQNGFSSENQTEFLQFSHLTDIPTATGIIDFHFGQSQLLPGVGASVPDNLFSLYWQPYYNELYNSDTRIMTLKVNLTPTDINTFNFFDTVMIKNRQFRVNRIDYKPNDLATVEFILVP